MLHKFIDHIHHIDTPDRFTYPFCYEPHPLCIKAAEQVKKYIHSRAEWHPELKTGKMFGVLVVRTLQNEIRFVAAFSGNLDGRNTISYFVPPVYDLLHPDGYFKREEQEISNLNNRISQLSQDEKMKEIERAYEKQIAKQTEVIRAAKEEIKRAKSERDLRRKMSTLTEKESTELIKQSQFLKAELRRIEKRELAETEEIKNRLQEQLEPIERLKKERKVRSLELQKYLFRQFEVLNAKAEKQSLIEIFQHSNLQLPPAGAGECAGPKLLQYAYNNGYTPLCMAEFWWGDSPKNEIRRHGNYYPACQGKCGPILTFMLQGLDVDRNPLLSEEKSAKPLEVVFEDDWIIAINKPEGLLSVPGKLNQPSVVTELKSQFPHLQSPMLVHRLDMDTSGVLLIAKTKKVHQLLQGLFETRDVKKKYIALIEGKPLTEKGVISLPLIPDYNDRPRQKVCYESGKTAITNYEVIKQINSQTLIALLPTTGRTHQLRVHMAHVEGLNAPIVGDPLYGNKGERLCLHAYQLSFLHPITEQWICITTDLPNFYPHHSDDSKG